jgi:glycosyltransferase involved in cell wall biosynthesis
MHKFFLMEHNILVSVLMAVYDDEKYVGITIESILKQTYRNFEFIIINDGSHDQSGKIIQSYKDPRVIYIENETNIGLTASLIKGFNLAKGKYLARIDSNDICYPQRLEKQVEFLKGHPRIGACGSSFFVFGDIKMPKKIKYPENHKLICSHLLFNSALPHVSVMFDLEKFRKAGLNYDVEYKAAQDYDLWYRASKYIEFANMRECLVKIRYLRSGISSASLKTKQSDYAAKIRRRILNDFNILFTDEEFKVHLLICKPLTDGAGDFNSIAFTWLKKLQDHNMRYKYYDEKAFDITLEEYWFNLCKYSGVGWKFFKSYMRNRINFEMHIPLKKKIELLWSCLLLNFIRSLIK